MLETRTEDGAAYKPVLTRGGSEMPMMGPENGFEEGNGFDDGNGVELSMKNADDTFIDLKDTKPMAMKSDDERGLHHSSTDTIGYLKESSHAVFFGSKLNLLMLLTPVAFLSHHGNWGDGLTFTLALLAIAPFAERLGYVTEQLAMYTNDTLGGLLNATFGNATEMIVSIFALLKGRPGGSSNPEVYRRLVQVSLLGSVLSNLLLVLGSAFVLGGKKHKEQSFTKIGATTSMTLLFLATTAFSIPAILLQTEEVADEESAMLTMSRFISVLLLVVYGVFLYFQLVSHRDLYEEEGDDEEDDEAILGFYGSMMWLGVLTVFVSFLSEYMVDAIEGTVKKWNVSELFIGAIIIPIVGNAAEHASALIFAYRDKMDITLGVAVGSAVQIAVSALPFCVVIGWMIGCPLDVSFSLYETCALFFSVILVGISLQDGKSHWMIGVVLLTAYFVLAAGFWFHKSNL